MKIVGIKPVFNHYKKISVLVAVKGCDYKCCKEGGFDISICHNHHLDEVEEVDIPYNELGDKILSNKIIEAVIFGGKETMLDKYFWDLIPVIGYIRNVKKSNLDIVIFTGYTEEEISNKIDVLKQFSNIIIKFGRFKINDTPIYDELLGISLASSNQYAVKIS